MRGRCASVRTIAGTKCLIFSEHDFTDPNLRADLRLHALVDEACQFFAGRNETAVGELGDVEIDVAMIEALAHFARENAIQLTEVDDHAGPRIDLAGDRDVAHIAVSVIMLTRAQAEYPRVFFVGPVGASIAMRRGEQDATCEGRRH